MIDYRDKQYISRYELNDSGYSTYKINKMVDEGKLSVVNRDYFENIEYKGEINDFYSVSAYAPKGVICLMSAAIYHGLCSSRPLVVNVALPRRSRVPVSPLCPQMKFYLFTADRYTTGIETIYEGENHYRIYDKEKTVCDMLFYRNKLGFEPAIEVLKNYINSPDRDLNKLMEYANKLRCGKLLREYLEVLV